MNKIFLIFLSITLINTMTVFSNRNINNEVSEPEIENEIAEEIPEEETTADENPDDTINTTESSIEDDQIADTDEETEEVEEEPEEVTDIIPDVDLTDEEKALVFKYIGKIDINYLMNLSSDGVTEEENILIIDHLKERLTQEEYEEVEDLIIKFLYSLEQE